MADAVEINVDWISISIGLNRLFSRDYNNEGYIINAHENTREFKLARWMLKQKQGFTDGKGRAPFNRSIHCDEGGFTYFYSDRLNYSLLEITGHGCNRLREFKALKSMVNDWTDRLTRIDIACDFKTDVKPEDFAEKRDKNRFNSVAFMKSGTGETCYVGSRKSDRYARVYKYNPPHPRAGLLRCEMVCKDERAKSTGAALCRDGLSSVVAALGEVFVWQHPLWVLDDETEVSDLSVPSDTHMGGTEKWLVTSVMSAIEKLKAKGGDEFIVYFLDEVYNKTGLKASE